MNIKKSYTLNIAQVSLNLIIKKIVKIPIRTKVVSLNGQFFLLHSVHHIAYTYINYKL